MRVRRHLVLKLLLAGSDHDQRCHTASGGRLSGSLMPAGMARFGPARLDNFGPPSRRSVAVSAVWIDGNRQRTISPCRPGNRPGAIRRSSRRAFVERSHFAPQRGECRKT